MIYTICINLPLAKTASHKYNRLMNNRFKQGAIEGSTIAIILLSLALIGAGVFGIWSFLNYREAQINVDGKVDLAVAEAVKKQADEDEAKFAEREKEPNREFAGPADLGHVSFMYPKTWSLYVDNQGSNNEDYSAYLHPVSVPPVPRDRRTQQRFAVRVFIYNNSMDQVLKEYEKAIQDGEVSSSQVTYNGKNGTKLEGLFPFTGNKDDRIRGIAVFFKVNDKTLMVRTDAETFKGDYEKILNTIKFN